jgi:hypothetical protein
MGEWKACVTMRIRPQLRDELLQFADQEQRSLGSLGAILLEWAVEQLKSAGSTQRLRRCKIRLPSNRSQRQASHD